MPELVHSSRFDKGAINSHHPAAQFKISSAWSLLAGSLVFGSMGILWLAMDLGFLLDAMSAAWLGDHTRLQRFWLALFSFVFLSLHSFGGIILLLGTIDILCSPYRVILDGNGQLIILSLPGRKRIAVEDIQSVELEQKNDETVPSGIRLQHSEGKVILPLFKGYEKFVDKLRIVCPAIGITNTASPVKAPTGNPF